MATVTEVEFKLSDSKIKAEIQTLRQTDNWTNWYYLARTYVFLAVVIGLGVAVCELARQGAIHWLWAVPVSLAVIVCVGAGMHQLSGLAHEGVHHILFKNRWLNDLAADWFTMFPLFGSIYLYRLQHLAHHQFVNDPDRDPDVSQLRASGHWQEFPVEPKTFLGTLAKQLWLPNLFRFIRIRGKYNGTGAEQNPYYKPGQKPSRTAVRIGLLYLLGLVVLLTVTYQYGQAYQLLVFPALAWLAVAATFAALPRSRFIQSRLHPVVPPQLMSALRTGFITLVFSNLVFIMKSTGVPAPLYYVLFWILPLVTSFTFFMILRQLVQHGNADRGWLTNTRVFDTHPFIRFAVFPMGQDYHLPHHMYATVPHFRLHKLHELLSRCPEYRQAAITVDGYFSHRHQPAHGPTVLEVLGPAYDHQEPTIFVDDSVLEGDQFDELQAIRQESESLRNAPADTTRPKLPDQPAR